MPFFKEPPMLRPVLCINRHPLAALLALMLVSAPGFANDTNVIIKGIVAGGACEVINNDGSNGKSVDLGTVPAAVLGTSNAAWTWTNFSIGLDRCPTRMTRATITFTGEVDPENALYYKNSAVKTDSSPDVAENVAIELAAQGSNTQLSNGNSLTTEVNSQTHGGEFLLKARMISPAGRATVGKVSGHVEFLIDYK
ncbi:type 1 fimbrial protein [Ewingella americana]|uniref:Type 1 fimbrial protein n=2 Tax=Ewingella americana TaxID=41202 RepID=A0A502GAZ0_9GAMM|nr:type 1 fimbrial protein [Ewingella americana]